MSEPGQKSTRVKTKQKFNRVSDDLRRASLAMGEIEQLYAKPFPLFGEACQNLIKIITMAEELARDLRSQF